MHVPEAPSPLKQSISVMSLFPSHSRSTPHAPLPEPEAETPAEAAFHRRSMGKALSAWESCLLSGAGLALTPATGSAVPAAHSRRTGTVGSRAERSGASWGRTRL